MNLKHRLLQCKAKHEKKAVAPTTDGTCNPLSDRLLDINFYTEKKCQYAIGSIAGIYLCDMTHRMPEIETIASHIHHEMCPFQVKEGLEYICKRYTK